MEIMKRLALVTNLLLAPTAAFPETTAGEPTAAPAPSASSLHLDLEVDPTAYALSGYSAHVGIGWERLRVDLGVFAMDVPRFVHGNDGFSSSFDGFGATVQYFPFAEQAGAFLGLGGGRSRQHVDLDGTVLSSRRSKWNAGVDVGWRFTIGRSFYVTPWVGLDHTFGAEDVTLAGRTYKNGSWSVFPAVHLGYRFR
jgi:hypothetical protein